MLTPDVVSRDLWGFFHAGHIATDLKGAITVDQGERASAARERLVGHRFDQAPVILQERIVGWVLTSSLHEEQAVGSVMIPLDQSAIVSAESSVASALQVLGQHNFVFTADKDGLSGFIVPSDIDRHAARSYFYLLVAGIEMLLSEVISFAISEETLIAIMRADVRKRYDQARNASSETNAVEYLFIKQLVELFLTTSCADDSHLWNKQLTQQLMEVRNFRNIVMHPTCSIAAAKSPREAAELASAAEYVAERLREMVITLGRPSPR
jgi:hypothetical protein